eukprot:22537_1
MSDLQAKFDQYINKYGKIPNATQFKKFAGIKYSEASKFIKTSKGRNRSTSTMKSNTIPKMKTRPSSKSLLVPKPKSKPKRKTNIKQQSKNVSNPSTITETSNPYLDSSITSKFITPQENETFIKQHSKSPKVSISKLSKTATQKQTKCHHINCKCNKYIENTSRWSKNKCKSCNHKKQKHFSTQTQTQNKPKTIVTNNKQREEQKLNTEYIGRNRAESVRVTNTQDNNAIPDKIEWNNIMTRQKSNSVPAIDINQQNLYSNTITTNPYIDSIEKMDSTGRMRSESVRQNIEDNINEPQWDNILPRMKSNSVPFVELNSNNKDKSVHEIVSIGVETKPKTVSVETQRKNSNDDMKIGLDIDYGGRTRSESVKHGMDNNMADMVVWDNVITRSKSNSVPGYDANQQLIEQAMDPKVKQFIDLAAGQSKSYESKEIDDDIKSPESYGHNDEDINDSDTIIIDNGSDTIKIGFGCTDDKHNPWNIFKSVIGFDNLTNETFIGNRAYNKNEIVKTVKLCNVINRGNVINWDYMETLWEYSFSKLSISAWEYNVLLTETVLRNNEEREKSVECLFESFDVNSMYLQNEACLSLYANGLMTGTVLGIGYGSTYCASIFEGFSVPQSVFKINSGGYDLTQYLKRLLANKHKIFTQNKQRYDKLIDEIKHKYCFVADIDMQTKTVDKYRLPDGEWIDIDMERYKCCEQLFGGFMNLNDESISEKNTKLLANNSGIHNLIYESVHSVNDNDLRNEFYSNVILSGGSTLFDNLPNRLRNEIIKLENKISKFIPATDSEMITNLGGMIHGKDFDGNKWRIYSSETKFLRHITSPSCFTLLSQLKPFPKHTFELMINNKSINNKYILNRLLNSAHELLKSINKNSKLLWTYFNEYILPWNGIWGNEKNFKLLQ